MLAQAERSLASGLKQNRKVQPSLNIHAVLSDMYTRSCKGENSSITKAAGNFTRNDTIIKLRVCARSQLSISPFIVLVFLFNKIPVKPQGQSSFSNAYLCETIGRWPIIILAQLVPHI